MPSSERAARRHALLGLLFCITSQASASLGDRQPAYQQCLADCSLSGCVGDDCVASCARGDPRSLAASLRLLRWDCKADCAYRCMHTVEQAQLHFRAPLKYNGKWPFVRMLGLQEPVSVAASLANLWAHARGLTLLRRDARACPLQPLWRMYSLLGLVAWSSSSLFHSRDTQLTEVLDYFSADALVLFTLFAVIVRVRRPRLQHSALLGFALCSLLCLHFRYMLMVRFDYGWNVQLCVAVSAAQSLLLLLWSQAVRHPQRWRLLSLLCAAHAASLLEMLDFPPLLGAFDAHSLWHAATPLLTLGWYRFLVDDCRLLSKSG